MESIPWLLALLSLSALCLVLFRNGHVSSSLTQKNFELNRHTEDLAAENRRFSNDVAQVQATRSHSSEQVRELLRLRGEVARLRQENKELAALRQQEQQLRASLATTAPTRLAPDDSLSYWPKESWTFAGYNTPKSTFQSMLWAASKGDITNMLACSTPEHRKSMEADLQKEGETKVAETITSEVAKMHSCQLLKEEVVSTNEIRLTIFIDGDHAETRKMSFLRMANEWKLSNIE